METEVMRDLGTGDSDHHRVSDGGPGDDPAPSSDAAVAAGCCCPRVDNGYGKGAWGGIIRGDGNWPLYWVREDCPLHGRDDWPF